MASQVSPAVFNALKKFTSCDVGDALVKLGIPYGGLLFGLTMFSPERQRGPTKVFGPAYTVKMVDASNKKAPTPAIHFVDGIPKESVVFISQPAGYYCSNWGGLMSTRAQLVGAQGVVIDGNFRDINEQIELGFPVFARDMASLGSHTFTRSSEINVPVHYTSPVQAAPTLIINPGDLILGDADGVVAIPPAVAEKCLALCEERFAIDVETLAALKRGEEFGPTVARLRKEG